MNRDANSPSNVSQKNDDALRTRAVRALVTAVVWTVVAFASVAVAAAGVTVGLALGVQGTLALLALWGVIIAVSGTVTSLLRGGRETL